MTTTNNHSHHHVDAAGNVMGELTEEQIRLSAEVSQLGADLRAAAIAALGHTSTEVATILLMTADTVSLLFSGRGETLMRDYLTARGEQRANLTQEVETEMEHVRSRARTTLGAD